MITKGIIKSIDLLGNTCKVHIPFFETAGNDPIIETATVSNTPGSYNGYKVGDAVYVAFEDGNMSTPVIIGKLYLGMEKEKADPRGVSNVEESSAAKKATLPADSKLAAEIDSTVPNTTVPYSSLSSIANGLNKLNTEVGQMDRDYGNRFKQVISRADGMQSAIEQSADQIANKVLHNRGEQELVDGAMITKGLGWELNNDHWVVKAYDQQLDENGQPILPEDGLDIFKLERDTIEINVPNVKLAGYPKATTVRYAYSETDTDYPALYKSDASASINETYINLNDQGNEGWTKTELPYKTGFYVWQWTQVAQYEYIESNDNWKDTIIDRVELLAINENISTVNNTVENVKTELEEQVAEEKDAREKSDANVLAVAQGKTTNYYSNNDPAGNKANDGSNYGTANSSAGNNLKEGDCWFQTVSSGDDGYNNTYDSESDAAGAPQGILRQWTGTDWEDIGGELVANKLTANYINALDITAKKITVIDNENSGILFDANGLGYDADGKAVDPYVTIAGFEVKQTEREEKTVGSIAYGKESLDDDTTPGIYIGTDGISIGTGFKVEAGEAPEISNVKLTDEQIAAFTPTTYWLSGVTATHQGKLTLAPIVISAMKKTGGDSEEADKGAYLWWKFRDTTTWYLAKAQSSIYFKPASRKNNLMVDLGQTPDQTGLNNADLVIIATHDKNFKPNSKGDEAEIDSAVYMREEIPYAPLNTPTINLTNDSASIAYNGSSKVTSSDTVSSTAEVWLNGEALSADKVAFYWQATKCTISATKTENWALLNGGPQSVAAGPTVTVSALSANTAKATCWAFEKLYTPKTIVYREGNDTSWWEQYGQLDYETTWTKAASATTLAKGDYFVVIGISADKNKPYVLWNQVIALVSGTTDIKGKCVAASTFYTKDFTITKQFKGDKGADGKDGKDGTNGTNGAAGRAVKSTTKYYILTNSAPSDFSSSHTASTPPNSNWKTSPDAYTKGGTYSYYETVRTAYTDNTYSWSPPVKNSMLSVDFINSLGITAKKIDVVDTNSKSIFKADGLAKDANGNPAPSVTIGGFNVTQSALKAGSGTSTIGLQTTSTTDAIVIDKTTYHKVNYIEAIIPEGADSVPFIATSLKDNLNFTNSFIIEIEFMPLRDTVTTGTTDTRCCLLSSYKSTDATNKYQNISLEIKNNQLRCYVGSITGDDDDKKDFSVGQVKVGVKNKAQIRVSSTYIQASLNGTASSYEFFKNKRSGTIQRHPTIFTDPDKRVLFSVPLRIYSLKVWVGGVLTANIIPAVKGVMGQLLDIQNEEVLSRKSSSSNTSDSLFKTAYPAVFLGANDAVDAPFSVSNTGEVRAYTGDIGGFVLTESSISSNNGLLHLHSDGTFTAKSGNIGGWTLAESGFSSENIKLTPKYLQVGDAKLYEEDNTNNRLIIKGAGGKAGFRIGRAAAGEDSNYNIVKVQASVDNKKDSSWILTLGPQNSTNNTSQEGEVLSVYVLGTKRLLFGRTEEVCRVITWSIEAGKTITNQEINLTVDFELAADKPCYIAWTESGLQNKLKTLTKSITQVTNTGKTGLNESYAPILPYYSGLSLGSTNAAWSTLYVKTLYYEKLSPSTSLKEPTNSPPTNTPTIKPGGCFDAGTKVLMADGTSKNIEDIQKGDKIYSYNTHTNTYNSEEVLGVVQLVSSQNLVLLTFEDGTQLYTTTTHPFYTTAGWVSLNPSYDYSLYEDISDDYFELMTVGQTFYRVNYSSSQPEFVKLSRIQYRHGVSKDHIVYNLDVSNNNTFFANGILGHNVLTKMLPDNPGTL